MLNLDFLEKGLRIVLYHIFCMIFQEKCFSCFPLLTDQISLPDLPLLLEILVNMCIAIVC